MALPPEKRFALLVWGPGMMYRATVPMSLEDAFYMRQSLIEESETSEEYSRIIELYNPEDLRNVLAAN